MSNKLMISLQTTPVAIKLLAQSKTVSSNGRGRQPSIICAFAELNARFSPQARRHGRQALVEQRGKPQDKVRDLTRRDFVSRLAKAGPQ